MKKYILVDVIPPFVTKIEAEENLAEIVSLIKTFGGGEIVKIIQKRAQPHPATHIGTGKAEEIAEIIKNKHIDTVILNGMVKSAQLFNLTQMYWPINPNLEVWDRVDLILQIFAKHARTTEAKLQIEIAKMRHMGPRMYGLSEQLGRQGGGIGGRGIGETNIELMKRHWRSQIKKTEEKLQKLVKNRENQLNRRRQGGFKTASIVGYTNSGKTTLFNTLTHKNKLAKDILFATLESTVGEIYFPKTNSRMLVADTIGFIQKLPPTLIETFKSTLMESIHADLILHVIDISDPKIYEKIAVVEKIMSELGIENKPVIRVWNKIDRINKLKIDDIYKLYAKEGDIFLSAISGDGVEKLRKNMLLFSYGRKNYN